MFQSSPNLSVGCSPKCFPPGRVPAPVSILIQPFGWVQLGRVRNRFLVVGFNPHPTSRLGAVPHRWRNRCGLFQSSSNLSAGWLGAAGSFQSSPNRVIEVLGLGPTRGFNPHPISRLGAVDVEDLLISDVKVFQSSPNREVGCRGLWPASRFNPHPTKRLGASTDDC